MSDEMINNEPEDRRSQAEDALLDAALREAVGKEQPTDQTAAILVKAEALQVTPVEVAERTNSNSRILLRAVIGIAAVMFLSLFVARAPEEVREAAIVTDEVTDQSAKPVKKKTELRLAEEETLLDAASDSLGVVAGTSVTRSEDGKLQFESTLNSNESLGRVPSTPSVNQSGRANSPTDKFDSLSLDVPFRQGSFDVVPESIMSGEESSRGRVVDGRVSGVAAEPAPAPSSAPARGSKLARLEQERFVPNTNIGLQGLITDTVQSAPSTTPARPVSESDLQQHPQFPAQTRNQRVEGYEYKSEGALTFSSIEPDTVYPESKEWSHLRRHRKKYAEADRGSGDRYAPIYENAFVTCKGQQALSTFSIDVDTASYANTRQFLMQSNRLPHPDAVRLEEFINYFNYSYDAPDADSETPFTANMEVASCPWQPEHRLVRIALKGREVKQDKRPLSNLVFLVDVSGSMNQENKLPLVVRGLKKLTRQLGENDRVAIVVYASSEGLVLGSTPGSERDVILGSLNRLAAGGSTAGGAGINLAYKIAEENFIEGGTNRVILCTDGDFNVGISNTQALGDMVESKAKETKVFLSVLGFGRGNLNDAMMESISNRGNGNYAYIDNAMEARKVLVEQMTGTLVTIAKDVKIQVEFNPAKVASYRLLGYENRVMANEDFNDDTKDAGEIGAGHTVTAFYEVVPKGVKIADGVDPLKYQAVEEEVTKEVSDEVEASDEMLTLKLRYKQPDADKSTKLEFTLADEGKSFVKASDDFRFAASVTEFGLLLRNSKHRGNANYDSVEENAESALGEDKHGYREEFLDLVDKARKLAGEE